MSTSNFRVLVVCTGNSARSQIGEALLATRGAHRAAGAVTSASAGTRFSARVHPLAIEVLQRHGISWEGHTPKHIDELSSQSFDLVITVCDNARDTCPYVPGAGAQAHWGLSDPTLQTDPALTPMAFEATYRALAARIDALLALPLESMDRDSLQSAAERIHTDMGGDDRD